MKRCIHVVATAALGGSGCGREATAPPGEDGWFGGMWTGELTRADTSISAVLWLEQDGDTVVGGGAAFEGPGAPSWRAAAPAALPCATFERTAPGTLRYALPTNLGADLVFVVSLDPRTHHLVGEWAADTDLADEGGDVELTRIAWLPLRETDGPFSPRVPLGCVVRPAPQCADGVDNDGDGRRDADDLACCGGGSACALVANREDREPPCANGLDDDLDGRVDALDPECVLPTSVEVGREPPCADGWDDDLDGAIDLDDPGCAGDARGLNEADVPDDLPPGSECADGYDNDGDGRVDLDDPSCHGQPQRPQESPIGTCDDGIDNDGDGLVDLAESTCTMWTPDGEDFWYGNGDELVETPWPAVPQAPDECADGIDDDGDGLVDLADPDCAIADPLASFARFETVPSCQNGRDDDGDRTIDALDPDCATLYGASEATGAGDEPARACGDGVDNDGDGAVDADDPHCGAPFDWTEAAACADGRDNDGDGWFDLADPGCAGADDDAELGAGGT